MITPLGSIDEWDSGASILGGSQAHECAWEVGHINQRMCANAEFEAAARGRTRQYHQGEPSHRAQALSRHAPMSNDVATAEDRLGGGSIRPTASGRCCGTLIYVVMTTIGVNLNLIWYY